MRRVLVLAYYFPPLGGAGTQRSAKFVQYLPEYGYEPIVVTGPAERDVAWSPPDPSLAAAIGRTPVYRAEGPEPGRRGGWRGRAGRWLRVPTPFAQWWVEAAIAAGRRAAADHRIDLVYASMSPFETSTAAATLARELGVPWTADLRDPWALDEWLVYPTAAHRGLELRRMRRALGTASAIVMNTPESTLQLLRRFPELARAHVTTVPNGFDAADFAGPEPSRSNGRFRIVHAGYAHVSSGRRHRRLGTAKRLLGGSAPGLDILARSHVYLVEALEQVARERPDVAAEVELHLAGLQPGSPDRDAAVPLVAHGYLPHDRTVELLRSAHLLFLPMHDLKPGLRSRIVPGKTYEYLAARRPILAAVPDGDARELLERSGVASITRPRDVDAMARAVIEAVERRRSGTGEPSVASGLLEEFDRRALTARLAAALDAVAPVS